MALEYVYDSVDVVPAEYKDLYVEKEGKFHLTGITGLKTPQDVANVQEALRKEREDHGLAKNSLKAWGELKPDEVLPILDEYPTLKELSEGKGGDIDEKVASIVEKRLAATKAPLERELKQLRDSTALLTEENGGLKNRISLGEKNSILRKAALDAKVLPSAVEDILVIAGSHMDFQDGKLITKEGGPVMAGLDPVAYLAEMPTLRPHWWPATAGGGAGGSGPGGTYGNNPWSDAHWNMTNQGIEYKKDSARATKMAEAAGTKIGGKRPVQKK